MSGKISTDIDSELGIGPDLVRRCTREFKLEGVKSFSGNGNMNRSPEEKEIHALKKALNESEIEKKVFKNQKAFAPAGIILMRASTYSSS